MFVFWSLIQYFTVHLLTLYTKVKEILKEIQRYKKQNTFVLFFSGSDELCYLANDICKTGFCNIFFNAHHLSMFERTTRYRKIGHILPSSNFIIPIVWYERVCYPLLM